jgi:hypothetical protein
MSQVEPTRSAKRSRPALMSASLVPRPEFPRSREAGGMSSVELAEKVTADALQSSRGAYDLMHDRAHKFATIVAGGAGGAGIYALGKIGLASAWPQVVSLGALSIWWFVIAGTVLLRAAASRPLMAGTSSAAIRSCMRSHLDKGDNEDIALWKTRWQNLAAVDLQIKGYARGTTARAQVLDRAYWCIACSPAIGVLGYLAVSNRVHA